MAKLRTTKDGRRYYVINGKREYIECGTMRRKLVTYEKINLRTGTVEPDPTKPKAYVTERCGVPLFKKTERERGTCSSCAAGWTHPDNMPIDE